MQKIPKILHWCWFGDKPMPQTNKDCVKSWAKVLPPDFKIQLWNERNFNVRLCKFTADAYRTKNYAFVSDYVRWYVLHTFGGVYVDSDVSLLKDITPLLEHTAFGGVSNGGMFASGLILGSVPDFEICARMLQMYDNERFLTDRGEPIYVNCVLRETQLMEEFGFDMDKAHTIQDCGGMQIYPREYFCGYNPETGEVYATEKTYAMHQFSGTWMPEWMRLKVMQTNKGYKRHYDTIYNEFTY